MPNTTINHSRSITNVNNCAFETETLTKSSSKKSVMSTSLVETSNGKIRLPSLKKLRNKLSIRKSHSSAANLSELSKLKITTTITNPDLQNTNTNNNLQINPIILTTTTRYNSTYFDNSFTAIQEESTSSTCTGINDTTTTTTITETSNENINNNNNCNISKVKMRNKQKLLNKSTDQYLNNNVTNKRISLPADMINYDMRAHNINHQNISTNNLNSPTLFYMKPLNRNSRRESMSELGYGKIESYKRLEKLGEGTYATVYKAESTINGSFVALKEIRLEYEEGAPCTAIREASLLRQLKHANIVTLHDIIYTEKSLTLVFEYLEKDLKQYMEDCNNIMSIKNVKIFLFQLLRGLAYCHSRHILHRDLKPQNLLINQKGELKLADFGLARAKSIPTKTYSNEVVTLWYRPPDVLLGSTDYSTHIDMWGVGCIFYEMTCGKSLFPGTKVEDELYLIFRTLGTPTEETLPGVTANNEFLSLHLPFFPQCESLSQLAPRLDHDGIDLLASFLKYDPKLRISAQNSIKHKYFSTFPNEIFTLDNNQSIFDVASIVLAKDPGMKLNTTGIRLHNMYIDNKF